MDGYSAARRRRTRARSSTRSSTTPSASGSRTSSSSTSPTRSRASPASASTASSSVARSRPRSGSSRSRSSSLESLGLPAVLEDFTRKPRGFVLVTGPDRLGQVHHPRLDGRPDQRASARSTSSRSRTRSSSSTRTRSASSTSARSAPTRTDFATALKAALREDPDVILVGEMRDLETISTALTAAETGHLVFATLHTQSTAQTVDRIIDVFPPHQQQQVRMQLSIALAGDRHPAAPADRRRRRRGSSPARCSCRRRPSAT